MPIDWRAIAFEGQPELALNHRLKLDGRTRSFVPNQFRLQISFDSQHSESMLHFAYERGSD
jgi:hypothetical protein